MPGQRTGTFLVTAPVLAAMQTHAGQKPQIKPAVPVDPIPAIVEAFQSHRVVAISDAHGNEQAQAFLISLVRDPRFSAVVNDTSWSLEARATKTSWIDSSVVRTSHTTSFAGSALRRPCEHGNAARADCPGRNPPGRSPEPPETLRIGRSQVMVSGPPPSRG
jgi:hypothetical protein